MFPPSPNEKVIAVASTLTATEQAGFKELSPRVAAWLATQKKLTVTPSVHATIIARISASNTRVIERTVLDAGGFGLNALALSQPFADFVASRSTVGPDGTVIPAVETGAFPAKDLVRWAKLANLADNGRTVQIAIQAKPAGS